jgi:GNAT superfamily N-acetyltransferase
MSDELLIREAVETDSAPIAGLLGELGYLNEASFVAGRLQLAADSAADHVLVAERGGQVLGFASLHLVPLFHQEGNLCRITAIAVSRSARRQGVGRRLLAAAEKFAQGNGAIRMEITSGEHRPGAHAFYRQVGYAEEGRRFVKHL